jgi:Ran GTPase-activating protein (RanGAP) involved in mRNA processing and transport
MWEELGWPGVKAIIESLKAASYPHLRSIRLWKTYCEDEGVRSICSFLDKNASVLCLELLDDKVSPLGCEFIGKTLTPGPSCPPIQILKLDHNDFGSKGLINLCKGLKENINLTTLSLTYCEIDHTGARSLMELLIFSKSKLEELILTGNNLRNEGAKMVLNGVSIAKELKKIYLGDN